MRRLTEGNTLGGMTPKKSINNTRPTGPPPAPKKKNDVVGILYELPDGRIVNTYGFQDRGDVILYYFDDGKGGLKTTNEEFQTWKPRRDLYDFPNARNPKLPYEFDLLWDFKYISQLVADLVGHPEEKSIRDSLKFYNIIIKKRDCHVLARKTCKNQKRSATEEIS